jgi:Na+-driven multidrug efflux pump
VITRKEAILSEAEPAKAIVRLAVPATLALLAKAVYNIVDTAYIGMLNSDTALAAVANLPAQSMNCAARAESSARISSIAVITGAALNVVLDPIFMFEWGFNLGVQGASIATTVSQCVTFFILIWFYASGRSIYWSQPLADVLTMLVCLLSIKSMKRIASKDMWAG